MIGRRKPVFPMKKRNERKMEIPVFTPAEVQGLLGWYRREKRALPWRENTDPYRVWVSEIMLQQTRVEAVKGYFERFLAALPDVRALAEVSEEQLLKLWEGLGYYSRARNLRKAAQIICEVYGGEFPRDDAAIRALPGIGSYTAGAIASIAFGLPAPAVDGNVLRVLARYGALEETIDDPAVKRAAEEALRPIIPPDAAGDFAQSLIELGAVVCAPNLPPRCDECPLRENCRGRLRGEPTAYPRRKEKASRKLRHLTLFLLTDESGDEPRFLIRRRPGKGLLAGMYEFPNVEGTLTREEALSAVREWGFDADRIEPLPDAVHIFTHIEWHMTCYKLRGGLPQRLTGEGLLTVSRHELGEKYAIPSAFGCLLKEIENAG